MLTVSKTNILEYVVILMLLLASKSTYFLFYPNVMPVLFLLVALFFSCKKKKLLVTNETAIFLIFLYALYVFNGLYFNAWRTTYFLFPLGTYMILSNFDIDNFKEKFFNVVFVIAMLSVLFYLALTFNLISPVFSHTTGDTYIWQFYGFNFVDYYSWYVMRRHAGIFHEPGAYQIVLNIALLLKLSDFSKAKFLEKKVVVKLFFVFAALYFTRSTNAYLSSIVILAIMFKDKIRENRRLLIPATVLFLFLFFHIVNSDVVVEKFSRKEDEGSSAYIRMSDMLACLRMFMEHPLIGVGTGDLFFKWSRLYGNLTSSNGIVAETARLGVLWPVIYFSYLFKGIKRVCASWFHFGVTAIVLIMLFSNEDMMGFPIAYIFIFKLKNKLNVEKMNETIS